MNHTDTLYLPTEEKLKIKKEIIEVGKKTIPIAAASAIALGLNLALRSPVAAEVIKPTLEIAAQLGAPDIRIDPEWAGFVPGLGTIVTGFIAGSAYAHNVLHSRAYNGQITQHNDKIIKDETIRINQGLEALKTAGKLTEASIPVDPTTKKPKFDSLDAFITALKEDNLKKAREARASEFLKPLHRKTVTVEVGGKKVEKEVWNWQTEFREMAVTGAHWGIALGMLGVALSDFLLGSAGAPGLGFARIVFVDTPLAALAVYNFAEFKPGEEIWQDTIGK